MLEKLLKKCYDEEFPANGDSESVKTAVLSRIEEENHMKRFRIKPLIIAAAVAAFSVVSLLTVNATMQGALVKFIMGGEEVEGEYNDYVDRRGFRNISFETVLPSRVENFAIIFDIDAPEGEKVRVITKETDPEFMENLIRYAEAIHTSCEEYAQTQIYEKADPEDFGLVLKNSQLCTYNLCFDMRGFGGSFGGNFMHTGAAEGNPSGVHLENLLNDADTTNETIIYRETLYYYVGKE